jgi:hypothetical protein
MSQDPTEKPVEEKSKLSPETSELRRILFSGGVPLLSEKKEEIEAHLNGLEKIETSYSIILRRKEFEEKLIDKIEEDEFWQDAKRIIDDINYSAGYGAEIFFDKKNKLITGKIEIRHSRRQARHITPVALIERIIDSSLQKGANPDDVLIALRDKIQIFKPYYLDKDRDNDYIQKIFDYFNHPDNKNAYGIAILIKILAHLYNENILLAMNDDYITIPYQTNSCYLIPTLVSGGKKYSHKAEGSFIKELCKVLDYFENKIEENASSNKLLSKIEVKQMTYAIFAMFDYLPLPKNSKNPKSKILDDEKHRYVGEGLDRLYDIATNHLHFIFEAYPGFEKYRKEIFEDFLYYLSYGVLQKDLLEIFACSNIDQLNIKLDLNLAEETIVEDFTNQGQARGFASQYKKKPELFYGDLKENVEKLLTDRNPDYLYSIHPGIEPPETPASELKKEKTKEHFTSYVHQYLYLAYFYDENIKRDFNKLSSEIQAVFKINVAKFNVKFKEAVIKFFYNEKLQQNFLGSAKKLLVRNLKNLPETEFDEVLSQIEEHDLHNFTKVINLAIETTYSSLIPEGFEFTQENLATLRQKVWELRANHEAKRELTYSSHSSSGSEYVSEGGSSKSEEGTESDDLEESEEAISNLSQLASPSPASPTTFFSGRRVQGKEKKEEFAIESKISGLIKKKDSKQ